MVVSGFTATTKTSNACRGGKANTETLSKHHKTLSRDILLDPSKVARNISASLKATPSIKSSNKANGIPSRRLQPRILMTPQVRGSRSINLLSVRTNWLIVRLA
jgi:hypothetical protein